MATIPPPPRFLLAVDPAEHIEPPLQREGSVPHPGVGHGRQLLRAGA